MFGLALFQLADLRLNLRVFPLKPPHQRVALNVLIDPVTMTRCSGQREIGLQRVHMPVSGMVGNLEEHLLGWKGYTPIVDTVIGQCQCRQTGRADAVPEAFSIPADFIRPDK